MGNFSQDPKARAADAVAKRYVGVRLQQAVPLLDADWNLLEDLRRRELEILGGQFTGNGVPTGDDGFAIFPVSDPNDFGLRRGVCLVSGKLAENPADARYTTQPNFGNTGLDQPLPPLTTPTSNQSFIVYLDLWEREVDSEGDPGLVDPRIGVETAVRVKREWAVRVVKAADFPAIFASPPAGHLIYRLAQIARVANNPAISAEMITDDRETDASPRREIAYRSPQTGAVLVDTPAFRAMLVTLRDNVRDFLQFLTSKFVSPGSPYAAAEVMGFDTLSALATLADQGISLINAKALDTRGAFALFAQILDAENRFLTVWKNVLLPLVKASGKVYDSAYKGMVQTIEQFLTGPAPAGFLTVTNALQRRNLLEAQRSQDQINTSFGNEVGRPTGFLLLTYLGSPAATIQQNQPFDMRYRVSGSVTPDDTIQVDRFIDVAWPTALRNADGSVPFQLRLGPGTDSKEFLVTVQAPNVPNAQTAISLLVSATRNRGGLSFLSGQLPLKVGDPPPPSAEAFAMTIALSDVSPVNGEYQVPVTVPAANMTFRLFNNTNAQVTVNLEFEPTPAPGWIIAPVGFSLANQVIPARGSKTFAFQFGPPGTAGQTLVFKFRARDSGGAGAVLAEIQVRFVTISG